jgi:hypothetical protein
MANRVVYDWSEGDKITAARLNTVDSRVDADMQLLQEGDNHMQRFVAFEDITAGDVVGLSHYTPPSTGTVMEHPAGGSYYYRDLNTSPDLAAGNYFAYPRELPTGEQVIDITSVSLYLYGFVGDTIRIGISEASSNLALTAARASNTIAYQDYTYAVNGGGLKSVNVTGLLDRTKKYYVWAQQIAGTTGRIYWCCSPTPFNDNYGTIVRGNQDGSTTLVPFGTSPCFLPLVMKVEGTYMNSKNHLQVFKSSAAAFDVRFGVVGFAKNDALDGELVDIDFYFKQTRSGLTAGKHYYLSDTNGAISDTAGTIPFYLGTAVSSTELVRLNSVLHQPSFVALTAGSIVFQQAGLFAQAGGNTTTHYRRIVPPDLVYSTSLNYTGITNSTFPVLPGDKVTFGSNCFFYPCLSLRN